jgi:hypothetical protein
MLLDGPRMVSLPRRSNSALNASACILNAAQGHVVIDGAFTPARAIRRSVLGSLRQSLLRALRGLGSMGTWLGSWLGLG